MKGTFDSFSGFNFKADQKMEFKYVDSVWVKLC